jgi:hypothetical protein
MRMDGHADETLAFDNVQDRPHFRPIGLATARKYSEFL